MTAAVLRLGALRVNLLLQGHWNAADSIEATIRRRFPNDQLNGVAARYRAQLAGDIELRRRLIESAVVEGDARDPVQTINRQMLLALEEGRLRDADRFREASFAVYRAQGVRIDDFTSKTMSMVSAADAGVVSPQALREFDEALAVAAQTSKVSSYLSAAHMYAKLGLVSKARNALTELERTVADSASRARIKLSMPALMVEVAIAERRWADAVAMLRSADQQPDGPANSCVYCLPLELLRVFAIAGMADSALAQYGLYRRTALGSRPRIGPDLVVAAPSMLALARMYDARGDARNAVDAYRDYSTRFERADAELQPSVRDARARLQALSPAEGVRR